MKMTDNALDGELGERIKTIAKKYLGEPWHAEISLNDDGSYHIMITQILGDDFAPKNPPEEPQYKRLKWKKVIEWNWKSDTAEMMLVYKNTGDEEHKLHNFLTKVDVSNIQGTIENMKTRETAVETSENIEVDYMSTNRNERSFIKPQSDPEKDRKVSQKSDDSSEPLPSDEVSEEFEKAYEIWNNYLADILMCSYQDRPPRTYDLDDRTYRIRERVPKFSELLDDFNRLHPFGTQIFRTHKHDFLQMKTFYQELHKNIRPVGDEFTQKWSQFKQHMNVMIRVMKEKNDGFM